MLPLQQVGAGAHTGEIGGAAEAHRVPLAQRVLSPREVDAVAVGLFFGRAAGVKLFGRGGAFEGADVGREEGVERVGDARRRDADALREGEVAHLPRRVHARVRAPAARHADADAEGAADGFFELALHGAGVRLHLPAAQVRAVIGKEENCVHGAHLH